jgi:hypothetical protein
MHLCPIFGFDGEGVFANEAIELIVRSDNDSDGRTHQLLKSCRNQLGDLGGRKFCIDDGVAALDIGFNLVKAETGQRLSEIRHGQLAVSGQVNGAKKDDVSWHSDTTSLLVPRIQKELRIMARTSNVTADASVAGDVTTRENPPAKRQAMTTERARTLEELGAQFSAIAAPFQALVESAGPDLCARRPAPGSWSVAECLQHLNISTDAYFPVWQQVIASAGPRKTELNAPYPIDFWGRLFSWILEPPPRIRSKTPIAFEPVDCGYVALVLDGFVDRQQRILGALQRCRGRAIDQVKMASPVDPRIRYSIWSSFVINAAHQRRHLWQAEQAIKTLQSTK